MERVGLVVSMDGGCPVLDIWNQGWGDVHLR